ncbi:hypothetical protein [Massilia sp. 9I]|uniref:hypothetical protein n=1 Tax=Massilia sp. 9I TaxID=2653152 RepID=UPI0012F38CC0|nr:hypothetical protein [Massilia sp. 9I]VXC72832.1 exported hypothetical protein [Massilia sp. 9I]
MKHLITLTLACGLLSACASTTPVAQDEKVAKADGYAPTGTFIKRKDGTGLGPTLIGTVPTQEAENARNSMSSGAGSRYW